MNSSPIDLPDEQTFLLIRLPKQTAERARNSNNTDHTSTKLGSVFIYADGRAEFQDAESLKMYELMRNQSSGLETTNTKIEKSTGSIVNIDTNVISSEESDLMRISLQKDEAIHLGKVKSSTLFAVPRVDETDASTVFA